MNYLEMDTMLDIGFFSANVKNTASTQNYFSRKK